MAEHHHTTPTPNSPPTAARRDLFACLGGFLLVRGTPAALAQEPTPCIVVAHAGAPQLAPVFAGSPDAELIRLGKLMRDAYQMEALAYEVAGPEDDDPDIMAAHEQSMVILDQIEPLRATTLQGLHAKMVAFQYCRWGSPITTDEVLDYYSSLHPATSDRLMVAILADLHAMGAGV